MKKLIEELSEVGNAVGVFFMIIGVLSFFGDHQAYDMAGISLMSLGLGIIMGWAMKKK